MKQYDQSSQFYDSGYVSENFMKIAENIMNEYDGTMKKLAE